LLNNLRVQPLAPLNLLPPRGTRSGGENDCLRVRLSYRPAVTLRFPAGTIELDPSLEIDLGSSDARYDNERHIYVDISATVTAELSCEEPAKLLALFGEVGDIDNWRLAPNLVGERLWQEAIRVVAKEIDTLDVDVDDDDVAACQAAWRELLEVGRSQRVVSLPLRRDSNEFEILVSDPEFFRKGREFVRWVLHPLDDSQPE
jgi:hypothetical protein